MRWEGQTNHKEGIKEGGECCLAGRDQGRVGLRESGTDPGGCVVCALQVDTAGTARKTGSQECGALAGMADVHSVELVGPRCFVVGKQ